MSTHRSHSSSPLASERDRALVSPKKREDVLLVGVLAAGVALLLTLSLVL